MKTSVNEHTGKIMFAKSSSAEAQRNFDANFDLIFGKKDRLRKNHEDEVQCEPVNHEGDDHGRAN